MPSIKKPRFVLEKGEKKGGERKVRDVSALSVWSERETPFTFPLDGRRGRRSAHDLHTPRQTEKGVGHVYKGGWGEKKGWCDTVALFWGKKKRGDVSFVPWKNPLGKSTIAGLAVVNQPKDPILNHMSPGEKKRRERGGGASLLLFLKKRRCLGHSRKRKRGCLFSIPEGEKKGKRKKKEKRRYLLKIRVSPTRKGDHASRVPKRQKERGEGTFYDSKKEKKRRKEKPLELSGGRGPAIATR